jgi:hypothetical protein
MLITRRVGVLAISSALICILGGCRGDPGDGGRHVEAANRTSPGLFSVEPPALSGAVNFCSGVRTNVAVTISRSGEFHVAAGSLTDACKSSALSDAKCLEQLRALLGGSKESDLIEVLIAADRGAPGQAVLQFLEAVRLELPDLYRVCFLMDADGRDCLLEVGLPPREFYRDAQWGVTLVVGDGGDGLIILNEAEEAHPVSDAALDELASFLAVSYPSGCLKLAVEEGVLWGQVCRFVANFASDCGSDDKLTLPCLIYDGRWMLPYEVFR